MNYSNLNYRDKINLLKYIFNKFGGNEHVGRYCYLTEANKLVSIFDREFFMHSIFENCTTFEPDMDSLNAFKKANPDYDVESRKILTIDEDGKVIPCLPKTINMILEETINEMTALDVLNAMEYVLKNR